MEGNLHLELGLAPPLQIVSNDKKWGAVPDESSGIFDLYYLGGHGEMPARFPYFLLSSIHCLKVMA